MLILDVFDHVTFLYFAEQNFWKSSFMSQKLQLLEVWIVQHKKTVRTEKTTAKCLLSVHVTLLCYFHLRCYTGQFWLVRIPEKRKLCVIIITAKWYLCMLKRLKYWSFGQIIFFNRIDSTHKNTIVHIYWGVVCGRGVQSFCTLWKRR